MEDIRECKRRGKRGFSWTSARLSLAKTIAPRWGGVAATDCAGVGFGAIGAGGFLPAEAAGGYKTVACAYFRGRGACTQYDPKVIVGARTLDPQGDAYYGFKSHNT